MIPVADFIQTRKLLIRLGAPLFPEFLTMDPVLGASLCNWIGSDQPSVKWASVLLNTLLPWMKPASVPHDIRWSYLYNDGSRAMFELSNAEFRETLHKLADASFRWLPVFGRRLREARHAEAELAYNVLMTIGWDIWLETACPEPGPERLSDEATCSKA